MYAGYCNHFNIGAFMEKGLTMAAGQVSHQTQDAKIIDSPSMRGQSLTVLTRSVGAASDGLSGCGAVQTPVQKYWHDLLKYVKEGSLTPDMVSTSLSAPFPQACTISRAVVLTTCSKTPV